jgi:hypothetical protein
MGDDASMWRGEAYRRTMTEQPFFEERKLSEEKDIER